MSVCSVSPRGSGTLRGRRSGQRQGPPLDAGHQSVLLCSGLRLPAWFRNGQKPGWTRSSSAMMARSGLGLGSPGGGSGPAEQTQADPSTLCIHRRRQPVGGPLKDACVLAVALGGSPLGLGRSQQTQTPSGCSCPAEVRPVPPGRAEHINTRGRCAMPLAQAAVPAAALTTVI